MATRDEIVGLLSRRWLEVQEQLSPLGAHVELTWDIGESEMLKVGRRFASTFGDGGPRCHVRFAERMLTASHDRADAVIRHELGHVLDLTIMQTDLDSWAQDRGAWLPTTPERKADALAELVWGQTIRYDAELVQTLGPGVTPRPESLGL